MTEVIIVGEGQTEEVFIKEILGPALVKNDIVVHPRLIGTSRYSKGGSLKAQRVLRFLRNTLRERQDTYVTTFFDLYALPSDFPGLSVAAIPPDPLDRTATVEADFHTKVIQEAGCHPERFLPHIQPYEFESLLFSDTGRFAETEPEWTRFVGQLETARRAAASPEHINDGPDTHPSARLIRLLSPRYSKVRHGTAVSARIGVTRMRAECRHFGQWLTRLENLPPLSPST